MSILRNWKSCRQSDIAPLASPFKLRIQSSFHFLKMKAKPDRKSMENLKHIRFTHRFHWPGGSEPLLPSLKGVMLQRGSPRYGKLKLSISWWDSCAPLVFLNSRPAFAVLLQDALSCSWATLVASIYVALAALEHEHPERGSTRLQSRLPLLHPSKDISPRGSQEKRFFMVLSILSKWNLPSPRKIRNKYSEMVKITTTHLSK